jgi:hypothetical protein
MPPDHLLGERVGDVVDVERILRRVRRHRGVEQHLPEQVAEFFAQVGARSRSTASISSADSSTRYGTRSSCVMRATRRIAPAPRHDVGGASQGVGAGVGAGSIGLRRSPCSGVDDAMPATIRGSRRSRARSRSGEHAEWPDRACRAPRERELAEQQRHREADTAEGARREEVAAGEPVGLRNPPEVRARPPATAMPMILPTGRRPNAPEGRRELSGRHSGIATRAAQREQRQRSR